MEKCFLTRSIGQGTLHPIPHSRGPFSIFLLSLQFVCQLIRT